MVCLLSYADQQPIILSHKGIQHDRSELPVYNDMPLAYYDNGGKTREIIIDGGGVVSYFSVTPSSYK